MQNPHDDLSMIDAASRIMKEGLHPPIPSDVPEYFQRLLKDCWQISFSERPSFKQICDRIQSWGTDSSESQKESPPLPTPPVQSVYNADEAPYMFSPN